MMRDQPRADSSRTSPDTMTPAQAGVIWYVQRIDLAVVTHRDEVAGGHHGSGEDCEQQRRHVDRRARARARTGGKATGTGGALTNGGAAGVTPGTPATGAIGAGTGTTMVGGTGTGATTTAVGDATGVDTGGAAITRFVTVASHSVRAPPPLADPLHWSTLIASVEVVVEVPNTRQVNPTLVPPFPEPLH